MSRFATFPWPADPRRRRLWICYYLCLVVVQVVGFFAWVVVCTPNTGRPPRPLGAQVAYAWGWVWINTHSGIYRHVDARWWGSTQQGKYRPEWMARWEGDRETRNGQ